MLTKRGRPEFTDRSIIKSKAMTIILTDDVENKLNLIAKQQKRKKAALARLMIEQMIEAIMVK